MFQDIEERLVERSECEQRNELRLILNHPFLGEIYELYTRYAFELMLNEYMKSHQYTVYRDQHHREGGGRLIMSELEPGLYTVKDATQKYDVAIRCKC